MAETPSHSRAAVRAIFPCLLVLVLIKSAKYHQDAPGFHFHRYWEEPPCFVMLLRDSIEISLSKPGLSFLNHPNRNGHRERLNLDG